MSAISWFSLGIKLSNSAIRKNKNTLPNARQYMPKIQTINIFLEHIANSGWRKSMTPLICKMAGKIQMTKTIPRKTGKNVIFLLTSL
ncbi:MAG: hypothetical protein IJ881_10075 [Neisseriaceae bacterium]|nr:hypothetical protein [Neisseriaceae bacterium]